MCLDNVRIFMRKHLCLLIDDIRSLYMHICQNIEWKLADKSSDEPMIAGAQMCKSEDRD